MDIEKNESEIENLSINNPNNQNSTPAINIRHSELKLISKLFFMLNLLFHF